MCDAPYISAPFDGHTVAPMRAVVNRESGNLGPGAGGRGPEAGGRGPGAGGRGPGAGGGGGGGGGRGAGGGGAGGRGPVVLLHMWTTCYPGHADLAHARARIFWPKHCRISTSLY
jgi:hypothetical protein